MGKTTEPIATRLRDGFSTDGHKGYKGYLWRHYLEKATIDIWILTLKDKDFEALGDDPNMKRAKEKCDDNKMREIVIETVEAEVVFLIRQISGQWPKYQTEIHFHQSLDAHREIAKKIVNHYEIGASNAQPAD